MHTGKVLLVAGSGDNKADFDAGTFKTSIWDPKTEHVHSRCRHAVGRVLLRSHVPARRSAARRRWDVGVPRRETTANYAGTQAALHLRSDAEQVRARRPTPRSRAGTRRWSSSATASCFTVGGFDENKQRSNKHGDLRRHASWSTPQPPPIGPMQLHADVPGAAPARDGRLFYSGANVLGSETAPPGIWNLADERVPDGARAARSGRSATRAMSVLLPPAQDQRVLIVGGGQDVRDGRRRNSTAIVDLKDATPEVRARRRRSTPRSST